MQNDLPDIGKISSEIFNEMIYPRLGASSDKILVGPQHGVDVGVVDIGAGQVMATTCDPVFIVPEYGWERAAWFAIHILASDAATCGLQPTYLAIDLNLPISMTREQLDVVWKVIHRECVNMGISIISGHTARYDGCNYPMVGGATVMSIGPKERFVTPTMAGLGDKIIVTKGAAIEATAILAAAFPEVFVEQFGEDFTRRADEIFWQMSVVEDAMAAASVGTREQGVTSMHDATECGVWGGLYEVAKASNVGMRIEKDAIIVLEEVAKICEYVDIDPYASISEGTLLITCKEAAADKVLGRLKEKGIRASVVGDVVDESKGITLVEAGRERPLHHPQLDPFWPAFGKMLEESKAKG